MNGGHETLDDAEVIVNNLGQGSKAVGGAARVGHNGHAWVVRILVDSHDEHGGVGGRSGDNDLGCTSLKNKLKFRGLSTNSEQRRLKIYNVNRNLGTNS